MFPMVMCIFAFVLFIIAAFVNPVDPWRGKLLCIGLACWVAAEIVRVGGPLLTH